MASNNSFGYIPPLNLTTNFSVTLFASAFSEDHFLRSIISACIQIPLGTIGSILCLTAVHTCRTSNIRSSVDPFFINMSVYVLIYSVLCCSFNAYTTLNTGKITFLQTEKYRPLCQALPFIYTVIVMTDVYTYAAIALHRFIAVVLPRHRFIWLRSTNCTICLVILPWILSILESVWPLLHLGAEYGFQGYFSRCSISKIYSYTYYKFFRTFVFYFSGVVVVVCYAAVFYSLWASRNRLEVRQDHFRAGLRSRARMKREAAVTKVVFGLTFIFMVCILPNVVQSAVARSSTEIYSTLGDLLLMLLEFGA